MGWDGLGWMALRGNGAGKARLGGAAADVRGAVVQAWYVAEGSADATHDGLFFFWSLGSGEIGYNYIKVELRTCVSCRAGCDATTRSGIAGWDETVSRLWLCNIYC